MALGKTGTEIKTIKFNFVRMGGVWVNLFGDLARGAQVILSGYQGCGKSTLIIQLALFCAKTLGLRVLYLALEEGYSSTLQLRIKRFDATNPNLLFMDENDVAKAQNANPKLFGLYDVVVIDSIQCLDVFTEKNIKLMKERYPKTIFFYISQVDKKGSIRGSNKLGHECDVIIRAELEVKKDRKTGETSEKRVAVCTKSRFGETGKIDIPMK